MNDDLEYRPTTMSLRYLVDGQEQPDRVLVLWTGTTEGGHVSLLSHPMLNYVIIQTDAPFTDGGDFDLYDLDMQAPMIELGRPDAGQLALALITALINNSDKIIDSYIEQTMAGRR